VRGRSTALLAQGRFQSLLERMAALPDACVARTWLAYRQDAAGVKVDPTLARRRL
jgi:hypothetical protein